MGFQKYSGNPVIPAPPGQRDFRDPKVFWDVIRQRWVMVIAAFDRVIFYASGDTRQWQYLSMFGAGEVHTGVWECPELFPINGPDGQSHHVLLVSVNNGAPNGGSGTQYFVGS